MGCCGCSLVSSTLAAGIYSIILSTMSLASGTWARIMMTEKHPDPSNQYGSLKSSFQSLQFDKTVHLPLITVSVSLDSIWLFTSILLLVGNSFKKTGNRFLLIPWIIVALVVVLFDLGCNFYYSYRLGQILGTEGYSHLIERWSAWIFLCLYYGRGGIIFWCVHVSFLVFVIRRYKEISRGGPMGIMGPVMQPLPYMNSYQTYPAVHPQYHLPPLQQTPHVPYCGQLPASPTQWPPIPPPDYDDPSFGGTKGYIERY
ncbi:uncharacterized protein LOC111086939 isoform X2 [Limulus polyphemus]|uniref:Uncharacterized protein LOC111086939 isoform X2 n=1 Tax=Limulus polyphemus TaxID=6850 RepID=A0ABM1SV74_LIMPO|nr:uncharacterized protein LOC111086939 isoform X2 [Limulus polyphemus]